MFSIVIAGDTNSGDMKQVIPLLKSADLVVVNLETAVTDIVTSPFEGTKKWLSRSQPDQTIQQLVVHNIHVVSLANNHTIDYGEAGLRQTLDILHRSDIATVGAGLTLAEARRPFRQGPVTIFNAFVVDERYETQFQTYARSDRAGTNPLDLETLCKQIRRKKVEDHETYIITLLHWRRDYRWRSRQQREAAKALLEAGSDLVFGHGSHMLQQIEKVSGRWVAHGLGNFVFDSPGRYQKLGAPPYSLVARIVFADNMKPKIIRLYPLLTDNLVTNYQTRFITEAEFGEVRSILLEKSKKPDEFRAVITSGADEFGYYLSMPTN